MTPTRTAAEAAATLTPAQRAVFLRASAPHRTCVLGGYQFDLFVRMKLLRGDIVGWNVTPLGLEVRAILAAQEPTP